MTGAPGGRAIAYHQLLLRIAGWAPDDMIFEAREWLAKGRELEVAQTVGFAALAHRIPIVSGDVGLLTAAYGDVGLDPDPLSNLEVVPVAEMPWFAMAPRYPGRHADRTVDPVFALDLSTAPAGDDELDDTDRAAIAACNRGFEAGVAALWRTWRTPALPSLWPPPRRVFLIQANDNARDRLPLVTSWLQQALVLIGEAAPQVEVFTELGDLPPYQRTALGSSALLWTLRRSGPVRVAELFDAVDLVGGPGFAPSRPTLERQERLDVLRYLDSGSPLLATTALMDDVVDAKRQGVVPMSFRTDGVWIWTDAVAYYLREYSLAPDAGLLSHIRSRRYEAMPVDAVDHHLAMAALESHGSEDEANRR